MSVSEATAETPLTVEYLKENYPPLRIIPEKTINDHILVRLKKELVTTPKLLELVSRESLIAKDYPLAFVDIVKPKKPEEQGVRDSKRQRTDDGPENLHRTTTGSVFRYVRDDLDSALPSTFNIGGVLPEEFGSGILPIYFITQSLHFMKYNRKHGNRRGLGSVVAVPGWGKTYALTCLAEYITRLRTMDERDLQEDPVWEIMKKDIVEEATLSQLEMLLRRCVPLVITLNSHMSLKAELDEIEYDSEIAKRMAYVYFANMELSLDGWLKKQTKDYEWSLKGVLKEINSRAVKILGTNKKKPVLLLIVDEPNYKNGASTAIEKLHGNALCTEFDVDCRVIFSSLEQHWLFKERTNSGRPIGDIMLVPPHSEEVVNLLAEGLKTKFEKFVSMEDLKNAARYIETLASGHWRTIADAFDSVAKSNQNHVKASVGKAEAVLPNSWLNERPMVTCGQLEEALAHSILGSELRWMEPLHEGPAWNAIVKGIVPICFGLEGREKFDPIVPLLQLCWLSRDKDPVLVGREFKKVWNEHPNSATRSKYLLKTLDIARFFPSCNVNSEETNSKLYEDLTSQFVLLKWDARERIDTAVRRRWNLEPSPGLMKIPEKLTKSEEINNYNCEEIKGFRDDANFAWKKSMKKENIEAYSPLGNERPYLWLVPGTNGPTDEFDRRLQIFRGAFLCTQERTPIQVCSPDASAAGVVTCEKQLWTEKASIDNDDNKYASFFNNDGKLKAGCVIQPAVNNPGFDSLVVLQKAGESSWVLAIIENKFVQCRIGSTEVKQKLAQLKKYRGVLWKEKPGDKTPTNAEGLRLPENIVESDVVWVMLHDNGYSHLETAEAEIKPKKDSEDKIAEWTKIADGTAKIDFAGHVLLTTSAMFFGPSFQKINLLSRPRGEAKTF